MWRTRLVGLILIAAVLGAGCDRTSSPDPQLRGVTWVLTSLSGHDPLPAGIYLDATFENGNVRGTSGCNSYGGHYFATADGHLDINGLSSTAIGCSEPVGGIEAAYLDALGRASSFQVAGDSLTLKAGDTKVAVFRANAPPPISGVMWRALGYRDGPVDDKQAIAGAIPGSTMTAGFSANGELTGSTGCNTYSATYTTTRRQMAIALVMVAQTFCPRDLARQEQAYLDALAATATWHFSGPSFQLLNETGTVEVTFAPA